MFTDQLPELAHLNARDVTFAIVSTAPQDQIAALKERMGWTVPWYTVVGEEFQKAWGRASTSRSQVFLRDGDRVFLTYETRGAGSRRWAASGPSSTSRPWAARRSGRTPRPAARRRRRTSGGACTTATPSA